MIRRFSATTIFYLHSFWGGLAFSTIVTLNLVYQVETVQLNPLQLVLVGTALELSVLIFEIPTGVVADVYSRRLSVIIGTLITGLAFIIEGSFPVFVAIALAQGLWGLGHTFISGAHSAWITDEVGEEHAAPVFLRSSQFVRAGALIGIIVSVLLGSLHFRVPVLAGGAMFLGLGVFLIAFMPETQFKAAKRDQRATFALLSGTLRDGFKLILARRTLVVFMLAGLFIGLYSEGYDRLWTAHMLDSFELPELGLLNPVAVWFGLFRLGVLLLSLLGTALLEKRLDLARNQAVVRTLQFMFVGMTIALAVFALAGQLILAVMAYLIFNTLRSLTGPIQEGWINRFVDSRVRATVLSVTGQVDALGQFIGGPSLGLIGTLRGIRAALLVSAILLLPVAPLYGESLKDRDVAQ
jgi:DHA3 family tetracycline resistance protein-like MFS transporter